MNFRYRLMQFMSGRYGVDNLSYALLIFSAFLSIINIIFRLWFLQILVYGLITYTFFRIFSRNFEARRSENIWFNNRFSSIKNKYKFYKQRKQDKFHIYKKCPFCKAILRLPHRIGTHKTICPRCNNEFSVKVKK